MTAGKHTDAFPFYGPERSGTPVVSFCRLDDTDIHRREPILAPDCLIIQDPSLFHALDVLQGVRSDGFVLINSTKTWDALAITDKISHLPKGHVVGINASALARKHVGCPIPNTALLGALAAVTGEVRLDAIETAIASKFSGKIAAGNIAAARAAHVAAKGKTMADA